MRGLRRSFRSIPALIAGAAVAALSASGALAQDGGAAARSTDGSWVGAVAPELSVERTLQFPEANNVKSLLDYVRGKVVVITFWSTTCASCPTVIPHLNSLAVKFRNEPVQFFSVLNEPEDVVRHFLSTKSEVRGWIGLDADLSMTREYLVPGVPMTVVVNGAGLVVARTHPVNISEQVVKDALAGRTPTVEFMPVPPALLPKEEPKAMPLYEVSIRPSEMSTPRSFTQLGGLRYRGVSLRELMAAAYQKAQQQIMSSTLLLDAKFDATVVPPTGMEENAGMILRQLIETTMKCTATEEERPVQIYVLRAPSGDGKLKPAVEARTDAGFKDGELWGKNLRSDHIAFYLFHVTGAPVMDESGLKGHYDINLKWNPADPASLARSVQEQLGLELVSEERVLPMLVVEREGNGE